MQGKPFQASSGAGAGVWVVGLSQASAGACIAWENPFIAAGQPGQQVQHVGRCEYLAGSLYLVADLDAFPLGVYVLPSQ